MFHDLFYPPAIAPLYTLARATERVRLGPGALNTQTLHPIEIARQTAALDLASRGRAYLGLVTGAWLDRIGIDEKRPLTRLREVVEVVYRYLACDRSGFRGDYFILPPGAGPEFTPLRADVPLMIGTWSPGVSRFAATVAREVKIGGSANPDMVTLMRSWLGPSDVGIVLGAVTVVDEDGDAARACAIAASQMYTEVVGKLDRTLDLGPDDPIPPEKFMLAGTPEEVVAQTAVLLEAGAFRIEFGGPFGVDPEHGLDLLCERVLPLLRE